VVTMGHTEGGLPFPYKRDSHLLHREMSDDVTEDIASRRRELAPCSARPPPSSCARAHGCQRTSASGWTPGPWAPRSAARRTQHEAHCARVHDANACTLVAAPRPRACWHVQASSSPCAPQEASNLAEAHGAWRALAAGSQPGAADANGAANGAGAGPPPGAAAGAGAAASNADAGARAAVARAAGCGGAAVLHADPGARPEGRGRVWGMRRTAASVSARGDAGGPAAGMPGCLSSLCRRRVVLCERAPRGG